MIMNELPDDDIVFNDTDVLSLDHSDSNLAKQDELGQNTAEAATQRRDLIVPDTDCITARQLEQYTEMLNGSDYAGKRKLITVDR